MRVPILTRDQMTPEQQAVHDAAVAGKRGRMPPPAQAWIFSPELAMRTQHLGEFIRYDTAFGPALVEVAILVTAKYWRSHYEWWAHRRLAEAAGLDAAIINAIRDGKPLPSCDEKTQVIYDYARTLHETKQIPLELHTRMVAAWGERGVAEIIGTCGYYTLVSMTLNGLDVGLPDGAVSEI